jgi:iron complex transport system substrate-binding protein
MRYAFLLTLSFALCAAGANRPQRIVSLSPDLTEMLYGVGAFPRVVGVSNYDTYPAAVAKLPHLGQLDGLSLERLAGLHPDLVVLNSVQAPFLEETLKELGMRVLKTSNRNIQEAYTAMNAIGYATGNPGEAAGLIAATRQGLDRVARGTARLPKLRVLLIVNRTPGTLRDLTVATEGSYLAELIAIAGGRIVSPPSSIGYAKLSKEDLLAINPDVILDFIHESKSVFAGNPMEAWRAMPELKAVREHRTYGIDQDYAPHASQRMVQTAELFARLLHPGTR